MSMLKNVTAQRFGKVTGWAVVFERIRQSPAQSNRDCSSIVATRIGSSKPQEMHGHIVYWPLTGFFVRRHPSSA